MHQLLDIRPWPRALLRYPLLILTAVLLGAVLAFAYSYAPLHRAKDWKISYLEERLEGRNEQVRALEAKLENAQTSLDGTPSNEEIRALRTQLGDATRLAASREKEINELEKKITSLTKSRDSWKSRHASAASDLEKKQSRMPPAATANLAAEPDSEASEPESAPAAPSTMEPIAEPPAPTAEAAPEE